MAHKKGEGSTQNGRDSIAKRLGVKLFGGQAALAGNIIIRQRGTKYHAGDNVYMGKDYTIHAKVDGTVSYRKGRRNRTFVSIIPADEVQETVATVPVAKKKKEEKVDVPVATTVKAAEPAKEEKKEKAEAKKEAPKAAKKSSDKKDNLKLVEGIGPKIESLLNDAGINTYAELAKTDADKIREILLEAGSRYKMHDPTTWPKQAGMAAEGKIDELKAWQDELKGGKKE